MARAPTSSMSLTKEYQKLICTAVYQRLLALIAHNTADLPQIRTPIILLKPTMPSVRNVADDYGLSKVSIQNWIFYSL